MSCPAGDETRGVQDARAAKKDAKKAAKALQRAKREGTVQCGSKSCTLCSSEADLLIRCRVDESRQWHMVCGACWKSVSGGVADGDSSHPHYQVPHSLSVSLLSVCPQLTMSGKYGGLWKNRHDGPT